MFLQKFIFMPRHKFRKSGEVVDALNRNGNLLVAIQTMITGMDSINEQYEYDEDFAELSVISNLTLLIPITVQNRGSYSMKINCAFLIHH